jgi:hypothetical protein
MLAVGVIWIGILSTVDLYEEDKSPVFRQMLALMLVFGWMVLILITIVVQRKYWLVFPPLLYFPKSENIGSLVLF